MGTKETELFVDHMDKVIVTVKIMKNSVNLYCSDSVDFPKNWQTEIIRVEREADEIKQKIIRHLMDSSSTSEVKRDVLSLLFAFDVIAENSRATVVKLSFLGVCDPDEEVRVDLQEITNYFYSVITILKEAVSNILMGEYMDAIEKSREVEKVEEKVDQLRRNSLSPKLLNWAANEPNPGIVGLFMNMVENIEEVVDHAEETANIVRKIAISQF